VPGIKCHLCVGKLSDRSGDDLHHNPDFLLVTATRVFDVSGSISGSFLVEYSRLGEQESISTDPYLQTPQYDLLNLRLRFQFKDYNTTVTFWGRNVLDEKYRLGGFDPVDADGRVLAFSREPVAYGVTLRKNF
jgi:iron complex outermembrane recepter protein